MIKLKRPRSTGTRIVAQSGDGRDFDHQKKRAERRRLTDLRIGRGERLKALLPDLSRAACREEDPEMFFPKAISSRMAQGTEEYRQAKRVQVWQIEQAKAVCQVCPEKLPCLDWAIREKEDGVWGGTTIHERRVMRKLLV